MKILRKVTTQNCQNKLVSPLSNLRLYQSISKTFLQIPRTPPLFHENKFITDFKEKAKPSSKFFAMLCTLLDNNSILPKYLPKLANKFLDSINHSINETA